MARPKYPSDGTDKTMVRFPPGLMGRIKAAAASNHRSMNAEIIATLEDAYPEEASVENLMEYMKELANDYADPKSRSATVLREIYDVLDFIRGKLRQEEEEAEAEAEEIDENADLPTPQSRFSGGAGRSSQLGAPARMRKETLHRKG